MKKQINFYAVIIGTEILNARRSDAHFSFLNTELLKRGWEQKASFVIKDEPKFIEDVFTLVKNDPDSVMFCFGGIGATPDDFTRKCAANVFSKGKMQIQEEAKECILQRFGKESYPHRINMANLPFGAKTLKNIVTNIPGFYLEDRFFFVPGFPSMAHPMVIEALEKFYPQNIAKSRYTLRVYTSENDIIDFMKGVPKSIEVSSLPKINGGKREVVLSLASHDVDILERYYENLQIYLKKFNLQFKQEID